MQTTRRPRRRSLCPEPPSHPQTMCWGQRRLVPAPPVSPAHTTHWTGEGGRGEWWGVARGAAYTCITLY